MLCDEFALNRKFLVVITRPQNPLITADKICLICYLFVLHQNFSEVTSAREEESYIKAHKFSIYQTKASKEWLVMLNITVLKT